LEQDQIDSGSASTTPLAGGREIILDIEHRWFDIEHSGASHLASPGTAQHLANRHKPS